MDLQFPERVVVKFTFTAHVVDDSHVNDDSEAKRFLKKVLCNLRIRCLMGFWRHGTSLNVITYRRRLFEQTKAVRSILLDGVCLAVCPLR